MSLLNTLADHLPDIQKVYYELKPLGREAAIEAIVKPAGDKTDNYFSPRLNTRWQRETAYSDYLTQSGRKKY
jgi:hypothetical protein